MSLSRRQLRALRGIERDLAGTDPRLNEFFQFFTDGFRGRELPRVERVSCWPKRMLARLWRRRSVAKRMTAASAGP